MGLKCSLLGHDYGETTMEREREEQGGEVIVEERELQLCARCGNEKVLSENTEVRTLGATSQEDSSESRSEPETTDSSTAEVTDSTVGGSETTPTASTPSEHAQSADEDDGVILEDDPDQERDTGQWPDEAQQEAMAETADTGAPEPEPAPWPDQDGDDEGFDAKPAAETPNEDGTEVDFGGGLTPESADPGEASDAGDEGYVEAPSGSPPKGSKPSKFDTDGSSTDDGAEPGASSQSKGAQTSSQSAPAATSQQSAQSQRSAQPRAEDEEVVDAGFTSAGPVNPPTGSTDGADTLLVCPECGFERKAARASLRAGDICPECRKGYLAERR